MAQELVVLSDEVKERISKEATIEAVNDARRRIEANPMSDEDVSNIMNS